MECQVADWTLVSLELKLGWSFGQVEVLDLDIGSCLACPTITMTLGQLLLEAEHLVLQIGYLLLQAEDGLPFYYQLGALGVYVPNIEIALLGEQGCRFLVAPVLQVFQHILMELRFLGLG